MFKSISLSCIFLLILLTKNTSAQSLFLNRGENGVGFDVGFSLAGSSLNNIRNMNGFMASAGLAINGRADIGYIYAKISSEIKENDTNINGWNKQTSTFNGGYVNICLYKQEYIRSPRIVYLGGIYYAEKRTRIMSIGLFFIQKFSPARAVTLWPRIGFSIATNSEIPGIREYTIQLGMPIALESREDHLIFFIGPALSYSMTSGYSGYTVSINCGIIFFLKK